jgi:hypothetical protein
MNDKLKAQICLSLAGAIVTGGIVKYVQVVRTERKKRQKIDQWQAENLECIANYRRRIMEAYVDESVDINEFLEIIKAEMRFLNIVQNQPMY